jgi:hypothetical protein
MGDETVPCESPMTGGQKQRPTHDAVKNLVAMTECRALFYNFHDYPANNRTPLLPSGRRFYTTMNTTQQVQAKGLCVLATGAARSASDGMLIVDNGTILKPGDMLWTDHVTEDAKLCVLHACQCLLELPPNPPPPPVVVASQARTKQRGGLRNKTRI